eukprot:TRINITY_DN85034_c0_g1_i1.p1 TRINITY_DN85034_c0_g1~~TRINITY_DN85034_c0_g1_i1.p1  ORF type:complete len:164 (+),score=32.42 TRINITY_DN85034_c0_g1_i1:36-494(+)
MVKHSSRNSSFALPRKVKRKPPTAGESEQNRLKKEKARQEEKVKREAKEARLAEEAARGPSKKELKRLARRQKMLADGKLEQTDKTVSELTETGRVVVFARENVQDEVELRELFPSQGTAGKGSEYFMQSKYYFKYVLAKDGTPVAQICKKP